MRSKHALMLLGSVVAAGFLAQPALARDDHWEKLGCQKVGFLVDHDVVRVGHRDGKFKAIRLDVGGNTVYMNDLKVVYGNGVPDDIPVRAEIRQGGQTRVIDLKGRDRFIDRIEMTYRAKPNFKGFADVCVFGLS
jgi:hypothetical protein